MLVASGSLGSCHNRFKLLHEISLFHFWGIYEGDDIYHVLV